MIRFVTALMAEATPIVDHYGMHRRDGSFPIYVSDGASLVVSGMGKRAVAVATGYLQARTESSPGAWVNVGIAGHRSFATGKLLLAHTIRDEATGKRWFPPQLSTDIDRAEVLTVERPETKFDSDALYEMEASAFYPTASSFATLEVVQCIKIVSDNRRFQSSELTRERIRELVSSQLDTVERLAGELEALASEHGLASVGPDGIEAFVAMWRLSVTERRRLVRLLTRWKALSPDRPLDFDRLREVRSGAHALDLLEADLRERALEQSLY
jgi:adenosylhomocysteine nucleosidase